MAPIDLAVGEELTLVVEPISRRTLALYAGASGDDNAVHIDIDAARASGLDDVIAHGMLSVGYLTRCLTSRVSPSSILSLEVRFAAKTLVGDRLTSTARVVEAFRAGEHPRLRLELRVTDDHGGVKATGHAVISTETPGP